MNRQKFLVGLLIVVAVTMLPYYFADRAGARIEKEMAGIAGQMDLLRLRALKVREAEEQLAQYKAASLALEQRLISTEPFATMERELTAAAAQTGMRVLELSLQGAKPVQTLPSLVAYTADVEVQGSTGNFVRFLKRLEQQPMLITIPDLTLGLPEDVTAGAAPGTGSIRTRLTLQFYGKGPGSK